ncbi:MAG: HEAT repeat domain-containing protein [Deltaproteobacteria bacterium]|nr:HEAT repeat domain-containing protein [Deltaproteobacteria bacterium]
MKNKAAVPVLAEATGFEDPNLTLEIVNALIDIGDSSAVKLFKDQARDPHYRVRVACLRGLYKLAAENDEEATQILNNALQDDHPDVRKSGATFLGWKGNEEAVPALVQGLKDEDERVTKAALSALAAIRDKSAVLPLIKVLKNEDIELKKRALDAIKMITGEEIVFDLQAGGEALDKATDELIDWWQKTRMGEAEIDQDLAFPDGDQPEPADETPKEAEEAEPEAEILTKEELLKKLKSELIAICEDLGIDCDDKLTKAEITNLIVERNA